MKPRVDREHLYAALRYATKHDLGDVYTEDTDEISYFRLTHIDADLRR